MLAASTQGGGQEGTRESKGFRQAPWCCTCKRPDIEVPKTRWRTTIHPLALAGGCLVEIADALESQVPIHFYSVVGAWSLKPLSWGSLQPTKESVCPWTLCFLVFKDQISDLLLKFP